MAELRYDAMGINRTPLSRLNELPKEIIEEIEPVLFPQTDWDLDDMSPQNSISPGNNKIGQIAFNEIEQKIFDQFSKQEKLKNIAHLISAQYNLQYSDSYTKVTSLFFRLANRRICHPKMFYNIDELLENNE
jgi:hypothetical protein